MITTEILSVFWYSSVHKPKHIQSFTFVCSMHCLPLRFCLLKYKLRGKNSITNYFFWHHWNHNTIYKKNYIGTLQRAQRQHRAPNLMYMHMSYSEPLGMSCVECVKTTDGFCMLCILHLIILVCSSPIIPESPIPTFYDRRATDLQLVKNNPLNKT